MKKKLFVAILAALLLLAGCQYSVVEDADEVQLSAANVGYAEPAAPAPTAVVYQKGDRDGEGESNIRALQSRLASLNYLSGAIDGIYGGATEEAVRAFQERNGLPVTGIADPVTINKLAGTQALPMPTPEPTLFAAGAKGDDVRAVQEQLIYYGFLPGKADGDFGQKTDDAVRLYQNYLAQNYGLEYVSPTPTPTPAPIETPVPVRTPAPTLDQAAEVIGRGSRDGEESTTVQDVQMRLNQLGYNAGSADGVFGGGTEAALMAFQKENGLPETGKLDAETLFALARYDARRMPTPEPTFYADGIVTDELEEQIFSGNFEVYTGDLSRGSKGEEVMRLQRRLSSLNYLDGAVDGDFGGGTEGNLKYFQKRNGLPETGVADEATQRRLFSADAVKSDRPTQQYMLVVSVSDQRVYAYKWVNGDYSKLVRTMICSTGTKSDPTPYGTYSHGGPAGRWYYFEKFDCWAQYAWRFNGPYLFHSVLYSEKDESTLRQGSVDNLGRRASHGCVRLKVDDARWIYNNCPAGTTVKVK